jgi:hypothetical protein
MMTTKMREKRRSRRSVAEAGRKAEVLAVAVRRAPVKFPLSRLNLENASVAVR